MKLYVSNLAATVTERDLQQLFKPFGRVFDATINKEPHTHHCQGDGLVTIEGEPEALQAVRKLHGYLLGNRHINVRSIS